MVINKFFDYTGMSLTDEYFLNPEESITARTMVYNLVKKYCNTKPLKDIREVINDLKSILGSNQHMNNKKVALLHYHDVESGALSLTFSEFAAHFEGIIEFLSGQEIVLFQIEGDFGICFEAEEYNYLRTVWGI
ncbi:hypothetical protein [Paenibacillus sp. MMS20-IR301]|uniref:YxiF family protein n=1 Tax=Paenibacillus sp. MMS20-IR301 TaxID=2895946 RepID=UPI0028EB1EEC|nr:hypothetical protein [Paenibacillus sp. MMS20-IR301]WNS43297.1 hypothetical protein LOS79_30900 [Paenibacillus sp. MMS20-IR301]